MIVSADDYFTAPDGTYLFNPASLGRAHSSCLGKFLQALQDPNRSIDQVLVMSGVPGSGKSTWAKRNNHDRLLIVDNTNLNAWAITPYTALAERFDVPFEIVRVLVPEGEEVHTFNRQLHGVPFQGWGRMLADFERRDLLPWWKIREV